MTKYPHIEQSITLMTCFFYQELSLLNVFKALLIADNCGWATITTLLFEVTLADGFWTVNLLSLLFIFDDCALLLVLLISQFDITL